MSSVSVEGSQGLARRKTHQMWENIWEDDPAYFSPSGNVPGKSRYFQQAWDDYNAPGLADNCEVAAAMFHGRSVKEQFKAGFSVEESLDYDASTLEKDPKNLEKFSPVDGHPRKEDGEDLDEAEVADVNAAAGRMGQSRDFAGDGLVSVAPPRGRARAQSVATVKTASARTKVTSKK